MTGVVVTSVDPGSVAEATGIQQGDVIQEVDRKPCILWTTISAPSLELETSRSDC